MLPSLAWAQIAYDDAANYQISANWTNGANAGTGFTAWAITTNGPDFHGTYLQSLNVPAFVIATPTNVLGTNNNDVWGLFANGTNGINETTVYRGFSNSLGSNTFKIQWGSRGAGVSAVTGQGNVHGWAGFTLRNGNTTNSSSDFQTGTRLYFYFLDGALPSTLYVWDANGVQSIPGTSFSDLGRGNITNAVQVEVTPAADGDHYHLRIKDVVQGRTLYNLDSLFLGSGSIDSAALFAHETTGDQIFNRMQITAGTNVPPTIVNVLPADGSIYLDNNSVSISFEVDSFNSTVSSNGVTVLLNGVAQSGLNFNTADPTAQLLGTCAASIAPDMFYTLKIIAADAYGNSTTNTTTFNTFLASDMYIDASDYNYTNGLFVDNATPTNAYANLLGVQNVDYFDTDLTGTNNIYRPNDLPQVISLATDATGDPVDHANLRANGWTAYNLGFTDSGEWQNYTRNFAVATNYSIYARAASGTGGQFEIEKLANATATTSTQPLIALGRVTVPNTGGSRVFSGQLQALTDFYGNTVVMPFSGTRTLRCTALSSRGYNLEYLLVVAVTNATSTLRPYIATGSPAPNASGVNLTAPVTFTLANRQTTVLTTNSIQLFVNTSNVTSRLVMSSNAAGVTVTYTPTNNLPASSTNTVVAIFTDSSSTLVTNTWVFYTGTAGGTAGNGVWFGSGGALDMNWATAANWTNGTPGVGFTASFASFGAATNLYTNNIVSVDATISGLFYNTNNSGWHTTLIPDGVTLTVSNNATSTAALMQVGGTTSGDNFFAKGVTNTITGMGGKLLVTGNDPRISGAANNWNFQVRQAALVPAPNLVTLDMSGLGTLIATVGKFYVAQGGGSGAQTNVSGCVYLARTNIVTCLRPNAGQFEVGDSSGGGATLLGSSLYWGITNAFFFDTGRFGKQKATNNIIAFNPAFTNGLTPTVYIRGTNATPTSRVTTWTIGDADTEATFPVFVQANADFSGGRLDALIGTLIVGRGATTASDTGFAQGTLTWTAGTLDVTSLQVGVQRAINTATETGNVNINGSTAALLCTNIILAQTNAGATTTLVTGRLNVTNGTVSGNIVAGGGVSVLSLNAGRLNVSNNVGTIAAPLNTLNLANASVHLKADGTVTSTNINAITVNASGTTVITIDSVANVSGPLTLHLIGYTGTDPFSGLSLAALPSGYVGSLVDNSGSIDLSINLAPPPASPTIRSIAISGSQIVLSGTNNTGSAGTYHVLTSTNLVLPVTNWTVLTNGSFDGNGNFSSTNATGTNAQRFYLLQVP